MNLEEKGQRAAEWEKVQPAYTIPRTSEGSKGLSKRSLIGLFAATVSVLCYVGRSSPMVVSAGSGVSGVASAALKSLSGALFAAGTVTPFGACVLAGASVATIVAIAAMRLPGSFGFMTANILGGDFPFLQFFGDFGPVNALRDRIFKAVLPAQTFVNKLSDVEVAEAMVRAQVDENGEGPQNVAHHRNVMMMDAKLADFKKGPTLKELVGDQESEEKNTRMMGPRSTFSALDALEGLRHTLNNDAELSREDIQNFKDFIRKFGDQKIFAFLHGVKDTDAARKNNGTNSLLKLELTLIQAKEKGGNVPSLPLLDTSGVLEESADGGKLALLQSVFQTSIADIMLARNLRDLEEEEAVARKKTAKERFGPDVICKAIRDNLDLSLLKHADGRAVKPEELDFFSTCGGQRIFFWLYHAMDLHLASGVATIKEINDGKKTFAGITGTPQERAAKFVKDLVASNVGVLATQECAKDCADALTREPTFLERRLGTHKQFFNAVVNAQGVGKTGTTIFLREDLWEKEVQVIQHGHLDDKKKTDKLVLVVATAKKTGDKFLHVSIHGDSSVAKDGREKIAEAVKQFKLLKERRGNEDLELLIGIDANTKKQMDIGALQEQLTELGLYATEVGSSTIKIRALTVQQTKAGDRVDAPGDHVITSALNPKRYKAVETLLAGKRVRARAGMALPNMEYSSDHLTVQLTIQKVWTVSSAIKYYLGQAA